MASYCKMLPFEEIDEAPVSNFKEKGWKGWIFVLLHYPLKVWKLFQTIFQDHKFPTIFTLFNITKIDTVVTFWRWC